jgi:TRAP-type C4-dicarboxylate transport system permease small subunit
MMKRLIKAWHRIARQIISGFGALAGACLGALVLLTTADVILRGALKAPILGTVELTEFTMTFIAASWIAYAQTRKGHITVDLITGRLPHKVRNGISLTGCVLGLCFSGLVVWRTIDRLISIWGQGRTTFLLHIPFELALAFICIGFFLYFIALIFTALETSGIIDLEDTTNG